MKCENCNYTSGTADIIRCALTGEEHSPEFECNCEPTRIRRDKEARIKSDGIKAVNALDKLKERLSGPRIDLQYVYDTLTMVSAEVSSPELHEVVAYIAEFL